MNNILIVDDEPVIVQSLFNFISNYQELGLNVWKACSAKEAIEIMECGRIDILLTDVKMPGMSGLELVNMVRRQWKRCKVIFLSGYSDYEYIQTALQQEAFDYLLKPVDDEKIIECLQRVILKIESEIQVDDSINKAHQQLKKAQHLLRREFFEDMLNGKNITRDQIRNKLESFKVPLSADHDLLVMIGRVDRWPKEFFLSDKVLLQFAISNIVEEYLEKACTIYPITEGQYLVWLLQVSSTDKETNIENLDKLHWYISEMLEKVQLSIHQNLKLTISFVLSKPYVEWTHLYQSYKGMCELLQKGIGLDDEIILVEKIDDWIPGEDDDNFLSKDIIKGINYLRNLLEAGDKTKFYEELSNYFRSIQKSVFVDYTLQLEVFTSLSAMFLSYMNSKRLTKSVCRDIEIEYLSNYNKHVSWSSLEDYYIKLAKNMFSYVEAERCEHKKVIVEKIDSYMMQHLNGDLSLTNLARHVHLSPYYLSRLYHMEKGYSLSEKITNLKIMKAKEFLMVEGLKVQDIAVKLGFDNVPYFTKFFKKNMGLTPQEFKQSNKV